MPCSLARLPGSLSFTISSLSLSLHLSFTFLLSFPSLFFTASSFLLIICSVGALDGSFRSLSLSFLIALARVPIRSFLVSFWPCSTVSIELTRALHFLSPFFLIYPSLGLFHLFDWRRDGGGNSSDVDPAADRCLEASSDRSWARERSNPGDREAGYFARTPRCPPSL